MNDFKYLLEKYKGMKTRHQCPSCQHMNKTFSRYIDLESKQFIASHVGRCNRESNCGYHYTPKQYFQDHPNQVSQWNNKSSYYYLRDRKPIFISKPIQKVSFIEKDKFLKSLSAYDQNHFVNFLESKFGSKKTSEVVKKYFIGTSKHWAGAAIFYQIDYEGNVRTGKIMLYNPVTGKRVKEPHNYINWVHTILKLPHFELSQVLFGEHLLIDSLKPCAIVESEKSAIISSLYFPQYIWLATGGLSNLSEEKCKLLKDRKVILFPDIKGFEKWNEKAASIVALNNFTISTLLETKATNEERELGLDIADYLLKFDLNDFLPREVKKEEAESINSFEKTEPEIPFENTKEYQSIMYDLVNKYIDSPILRRLLKEKPFTSEWKTLYQKLRLN